jgi:glutamyl-tRNA synthetase
VSHSSARFDEAELAAINARTLHQMPFAAVEKRLAEAGIGGGEAFWNAVRGNLEKFSDCAEWWHVVTGPIAPAADPQGAGVIAAAQKALPDEPWDLATWGRWTDAVKAATGAKGRALFHPLRLALTGREQGPELKTLLPFIGRERAQKRLAGETA